MARASTMSLFYSYKQKLSHTLIPIFSFLIHESLLLKKKNNREIQNDRVQPRQWKTIGRLLTTQMRHSRII